MARKQEEKRIEDASVPDPVDEQITNRLRKLKESYDRKGEVHYSHLLAIIHFSKCCN